MPRLEYVRLIKLFIFVMCCVFNQLVLAETAVEVAENAKQPEKSTEPESTESNAPLTFSSSLHDCPEKGPECEPPDAPSIWQAGAIWAVESRDLLSDEIDSLARSLDRFFSGEEVLEEDNSSFVRLRLGTGYFTGNGMVDQSDVKFRLSLPATQDKFNLIVENAFDADRSLEENRRAGRFRDDSTDRTGLSAAIQFFGSQFEHWRTSLDAGIVASIPLEPFVRASASRQWLSESEWRTQVRQRVTYFHQRFYQTESALVLEYPLTQDVIYRMESDMDWRQREDTMKAAQSFNLLVRLDDDNAINYQLAFFVSSLSHTVVNNFFLSATLRSRVYQDWLYLEWIPELAFPREERYSPRPSLVLRFEILFKD